MGLLLAGTSSDKAAEMLAYAHDTQHEKIIRGTAVGLSITMYGCEEGADTMIESMCRDQVSSVSAWVGAGWRVALLLVAGVMQASWLASWKAGLSVRILAWLGGK